MNPLVLNKSLAIGLMSTVEISLKNTDFGSSSHILKSGRLSHG